MRSGFATELPPNFCTRMATFTRLQKRCFHPAISQGVPATPASTATVAPPVAVGRVIHVRAVRPLCGRPRSSPRRRLRHPRRRQKAATEGPSRSERRRGRPSLRAASNTSLSPGINWPPVRLMQRVFVSHPEAPRGRPRATAATHRAARERLKTASSRAHLLGQARPGRPRVQVKVGNGHAHPSSSGARTEIALTTPPPLHHARRPGRPASAGATLSGCPSMSVANSSSRDRRRALCARKRIGGQQPADDGRRAASQTAGKRHPVANAESDAASGGISPSKPR